jgi:digeranylgeranylglycerophospholipid reductase
MRQKQNKVVIVGAGPAGCYLAQLLQRQGMNSLLIEEHEELGKPVHCAGLVGRKVIEESQIPFPRHAIINTIHGGLLHLNGDTLTLNREEVAYVIDREKFDKAMGENLHIQFSTKCLGIEQNNSHYLVETDQSALEADIIVGADGARSTVRDFIMPENHTAFLRGVQFRMEVESADPQRVEVVIEKPYFFWIIPENEKVIRVGVLSQNPYNDLMKFLEKRKIQGSIIERFAGLVPLRHFDSHSKGKVFLLGDSASQIKPLSYGGIYMGMRAAEILAECILEGKPEEYSPRWKKRFGKEITLALKMREMFQSLSQEEINTLFTFAKQKTIFIQEKGDFENHTQLMWELLKHPSLSREILGILFKIIKANL